MEAAGREVKRGGSAQSCDEDAQTFPLSLRSRGFITGAAHRITHSRLCFYSPISCGRVGLFRREYKNNYICGLNVAAGLKSSRLNLFSTALKTIQSPREYERFNPLVLQSPGVLG